MIRLTCPGCLQLVGSDGSGLASGGGVESISCPHCGKALRRPAAMASADSSPASSATPLPESASRPGMLTPDPELAVRVHQVCNRFEKAWKESAASKDQLAPRVEDLLEDARAEDRPVVLRELLAIELNYRLQAGQPPTPAELQGRFPDYRAIVDAVLLHSTLSWSGPEQQRGDTRRDDCLPARVGRYVVENEIARGGMGRIVRVRDDDFQRPLAMKVLLSRDARLEERFLREARLTGRLQHPGIPPVHELGRLPPTGGGDETEDDGPYFIMKLIQGRTLREQLLERKDRLTELPRFLTIFEHICQTVGYAHSRGVIHRDLKPSNIMVGAFGEVQVMDWGLAKVLSADEREAADPIAYPKSHDTESSDATRQGSILGTPAYMPPEQARGEVDTLDARCDVFGLGAILCEVLTGKPPYVGRNTVDDAGQGNLEGARARLADCGADSELVELTQRCLAPRREDRPKNGAAVAEAVAAHQAELQRRLMQAERERAAAETQAAEEVKRRQVERQRRRWLVAAVALFAAVAAVSTIGIIAYSWAYGEAETARQDAQFEAEAKERARKGEADERHRAEQAAAAEKQARNAAEKRLAQIKNGNEIILSIFANLDILKTEKSNYPLEALLAQGLMKAAVQLKGEAVGDPLMVAELQDRLGRTLVSLDHAREAIPLLENARRVRGARLGPNHPHTFGSMHNLAHGYQAAGKLDLALPLYEETLKVMKARLGPDHPDTFICMGNLARGYKAVGKLDLALPLYEETLKVMKVRLGPYHSHTLSSMNNLASGYHAAGKLDLALPLFEETLKVMKARLGPDHPNTLTSMGNLAAGYQAAGKLDLALPLYEETLKLRKAKLGQDHPSTLTSMNNLASCYSAIGKQDLVLPLYEETLTDSCANSATLE